MNIQRLLDHCGKSTQDVWVLKYVYLDFMQHLTKFVDFFKLS